MADSGRVVIEVLSADDSPFILTHSINLLVEASPSPSSFSPLLLWSRRSYRAIKIDTMAKSRIIIINNVCRPELRAELRTPESAISETWAEVAWYMHTADLGVACSFTFSVGRWIRWEVGCWLDRIASSLLFFSFLFFSFRYWYRERLKGGVLVPDLLFEEVYQFTYPKGFSIWMRMRARHGRFPAQMMISRIRRVRQTPSMLAAIRAPGYCLVTPRRSMSA